jgi:hypothetical protein
VAESGLGHKPFLGRLFGHTQRIADLGPGGTGIAGLVDEVPDQVVGKLTQMACDTDRLAKLPQGGCVGMFGLDVTDQVVEWGKGIVHASTLG